jgi:hypothetical protein
MTHKQQQQQRTFFVPVEHRVATGDATAGAQAYRLILLGPQIVLFSFAPRGCLPRCAARATESQLPSRPRV